jgi:uncharacterized protein YndB with AHSA1/START domain
VVYEVISRPEHMREWWPDEADLDPVPGAAGVITFGDPGSPEAKVQPIAVVEADPPRRFSFRWVADEGVALPSDRSLLVTFELTPSGSGTQVRFSETGFREKGWDAAVLEEQYAEHVAGWDHFLPRLVAHAMRVEASS